MSQNTQTCVKKSSVPDYVHFPKPVAKFSCCVFCLSSTLIKKQIQKSNSSLKNTIGGTWAALWPKIWRHMSGEMRPTSGRYGFRSSSSSVGISVPTILGTRITFQATHRCITTCTQTHRMLDQTLLAGLHSRMYATHGYYKSVWTQTKAVRVFFFFSDCHLLKLSRPKMP